MAEVDASITASAGKNMLTDMGRMAATMNAVNQNRLFMAKQAAGELLQRSINPETGQPDLQQFNRLLAGDRRTAPYAAEALTTSLAQQGAGLGIAKSQGDMVRQALGTLGPNASHDNVLSALSLLAATKQVDPTFAATIAGSLPSDPASIQAWTQNNFQLPALGPQGALEATVGPVQTITNGPKINLFRTPALGEPKSIGSLDVELSPAQKAERQTVIGPGNVPTSVTTGSLVDDRGNPKAGPLTGPSGEIRTGLAPGVAEAANVSGQQNAQMAMALQQRSSKVRENKAILGNMEGLLDKFEPGPQSGFWKGMGQLAAEYGLKVPGAPPKDKVQAQEEFGKLAFQLAQTQFQSLGGTGTDSKLDSTMHTSPSELLSKYGNKGIIALLKGNEDAVLAQSDAWQKWQDAGHGPDTYGKFLNQWNRIYDPRVFQAAYMSPDSRQSMLKGMTQTEQAQFQSAYKRSVGLGWVKP